MGFSAKYGGTCGECGEAFEAGTKIRKAGWYPVTADGAGWNAPKAQWAHVVCSTAGNVAGTPAEAARGVGDGGAEVFESHEAWNCGHGLCPDGCCGVVKECGNPACSCFGTNGEERG